MPFTIQVQTDVRLVTAVARRLIRPWAWGIGAALLLVAGVEALLGDQELAFGPALFAVPIALYVYWETPCKAVRRQLDRIGRPAAFQFDDHGIRTLDGFQEAIYPWAAVTAVEEWTGQIAIVIGWRRILAIPTGAMTGDERAAVLAIARSRGTVMAG